MTTNSGTARFSDRVGNIFDKRTVRHHDGTISVRRKKIACGILGRLAELGLIPVPAIEPKTVRTPAKDSSIKIKRPKRATPPPTAKPKTYRVRTHHDWDGKTEAYVNTTSNLPHVFRKYKARAGGHVELYLRDFELREIGMRSAKLEISSRSSQPVPLPLAAIQAQDRLKSFEANFPRSFVVCHALIVSGVQPERIPIPDDMKRRGGRRGLIQEAFDDLANFYTPRRIKPDHQLLRLAAELELERRTLDASRDTRKPVRRRG